MAINRDFNGLFDNLSQRVAFSYVRSLAGFNPVLASELSADQAAEMEASQRELQAYFRAFYEALYLDPGAFGLPLTGDACITEEETQVTKMKAELNRKLEKPRGMINAGLDFLLLAGVEGQLADGSRALFLDVGEYAAFAANSKSKKRFLKGMQQAGLEVSLKGEKVTLSSARFPAMMPALKALAAACAPVEGASREEEQLGRFNFARCDFRALQGKYQPGAMELYRLFNTADFQRVARLHEYFSGLGYKPVYQIYGIYGWEIQYQGSRKVKASPLLRVEYSERYLNPLRVSVKCASADRIIPLVYRQPRFLQEDFLRRANTCGDCGWCKNRKALGPSLFELDGVQKRICWYINPDIKVLDDDAVRLIEQYAAMHEELAA